MNPEMLLRLTPAELDMIIGALGEQPFKIVHGLVAKIVQQANSPEVQNPDSFVHKDPTPPVPLALVPTPPAALTPVAAAIIPPQSL